LGLKTSYKHPKDVTYHLIGPRRGRCRAPSRVPNIRILSYLLFDVKLCPTPRCGKPSVSHAGAVSALIRRPLDADRVRKADLTDVGPKPDGELTGTDLSLSRSGMA
jgi:hypothetical protein